MNATRAAEVLPVSFVERGHFQGVHASADFDLALKSRRRDASRCAVAIADRNLRGIGIGPPFALRHFVARRRRVGPAQFGILEHSSRKVLVLQLVERFAIERNEAALHTGEQGRAVA